MATGIGPARGSSLSSNAFGDLGGQLPIGMYGDFAADVAPADGPVAGNLVSALTDRGHDGVASAGSPPSETTEGSEAYARLPPSEPTATATAGFPTSRAARSAQGSFPNTGPGERPQPDLCGAGPGEEQVGYLSGRRWPNWRCGIYGSTH